MAESHDILSILNSGHGLSKYSLFNCLFEECLGNENSNTKSALFSALIHLINLDFIFDFIFITNTIPLNIFKTSMGMVNEHLE
ncbi:hypothetical protein HWI79_1511 [Cryptosporidium felis]|nr:hypothetical protein HWI79_1511 [Cryptosporidium felis]